MSATRRGTGWLGGALVVLLALGVWVPLGSADRSRLPDESTVRDILILPSTRDVWISAIEDEQRFNMGAAPRLKLKQWQELALVDFDTGPVGGRVVRRAALVVEPVGEARLGLNGGSDLRWLTVSTVGHEWVEGFSRRYAVDRAGRGASFLESSSGESDWGWPGARVWDVSLGNGNTLRVDGLLEPTVSQLTGRAALRMELDPRLVQALVAGASHGLLLMEGSTDVGTNSFIASREGGAGPYLEVVLDREDRRPPPPPSHLTAGPAPGSAGQATGALELSFAIPEGALTYEIRLDGGVVERWQVPFAGDPVGRQRVSLLDLEPDRRYGIEVAALGFDGGRSEPVRTTARSSSVLTAPAVPTPESLEPGDPPSLGEAVVYAAPEVVRLDPRRATRLGDGPEAVLRRANAVWSGARRTIELIAARGEIVAFQVVVEGVAREVRLTPSELIGRALNEDGTNDVERGTAPVIEAQSYRLWNTWYVDGVPEVALPLEGSIDVPGTDNPVPGRTLRSIAVDLAVPVDATPGRYRGELLVSAGGGEAMLAVDLRVFDVTLPVAPTFNLELNTYRGPGRAGGERFRESFRLAHYHRATINRVPYTHRGTVHDDWAPGLDPSGRIVDWRGFDRALSGLLDGSWFEDNPRAGVPVPVLYLPLFEGWPLDFRRHYRPGPGVPLDAVDPLAKLRHDTLARPVLEGFEPGYREAFARAVRDFLRHIESRGWDQTQFQVYLNNKPRYGYTLWTLDEPFEYLDWATINAFGELTREGLARPDLHRPGFQEGLLERSPDGRTVSGPIVLFRADVSRPTWMGSVADGLVNALYVSSENLDHRRLLRGHRQRMPALLYAYGTPPGADAPSWAPVIWCLNAFAASAEGVLPWQSIAGPSALRQSTPTGLIVDGGERGRALASLRLHALRRGAQDVELLRMLQRREGWSRAQIAHFIESALGPEDERGAGAFYRLRRGALERLDASSAPRP